MSSLDPGSADDDPSDDSLLREAARIPPLAIEPDRCGEELGPYRIEARLGQGAMGVVYAAEDRRLGRKVALKVLTRAAADDDERRRRFLREARSAAAVGHPGVAAVFEVGEAGGTAFLAMELVRGQTLRAALEAARGPLGVDEAISIALQIARGLGQAHAVGVVHRDLKPENVMLDEAGAVKLVDFGLARMAAPTREGEQLSTQEGHLLGTPSYMAPEQARSARVGPTADVFSLGVILHELLTGERPFTGRSTMDLLVSIARDEPPAPSKRAPAVPRALDRLVLRCLAKDPAARYPDGNALAEALARVPRRARPRPRALLAVAPLAALALVVALAASRTTPPAPTLAAAAPTLTAPPSADPTATTPFLVATASPPSSAREEAPRLPASTRPAPTPPARATPSSSAPRPAIDPLAHQK